LKCPCENCICLVICKHKYYTSLVVECILIRNYLPGWNNWRKRSQKKLLKMYNVLQPTRWIIISKDNGIVVKRLWIETK
jgi:hypothetical protein